MPVSANMSSGSMELSLLRAIRYALLPRHREWGFLLMLSGQNLVYNTALHVGETEVPALELVRQALVVDAEEVEHGSVQVMHLDDIFDGVVAQLIGAAVRDAALDAAAGQPDGEALDVVVAAVA